MENKGNVLVIGASGGIGYAVAQEFLKRGYAVTGTTRSKPVPEGAESVNVDVLEEESIQAAIAQHVRRCGSLEVLVVTTGVIRAALLADMDDECLEEVLDINLVAPIRAVRAALKPMLQQKRGSIVLISSISARCGMVGNTNYTASKAGLEGFAVSAAKEYAAEGIRINCIAPGPTETPMLNNTLTTEQKNAVMADLPMGRTALPEEVAEAVYYTSVLSAVTGATLPVSCGAGYGY